MYSHKVKLEKSFTSSCNENTTLLNDCVVKSLWNELVKTRQNNESKFFEVLGLNITKDRIFKRNIIL